MIPDGTYLVESTSNAVGAQIVVYEIVIKDRMRIGFAPPPGFPPPPFTMVTGQEYDPAGAAIIGVEASMGLDPKSGNGALSSWGSVSGPANSQKTDVAGIWRIPVAPSDQLIPKGQTYRLTRRHHLFGSKVIDGLFVPSQNEISLNDLVRYSYVKKTELAPLPSPAALTPPAGYAVVTGLLVNPSGIPMASVPVTLGIGIPQTPSALIPNLVGSTAPANVFFPESTFSTTTTPHRVATKSAYPAAPITSTTIPIGAEIVSVTDGYGATLGPPDVTHVPSTGGVTFLAPFVGTLKYRVPSDGKFEIAVPPGNSYWLKAGNSGEIRITFDLFGGISTFDIGKITFGPVI